MLAALQHAVQMQPAEPHSDRSFCCDIHEEPHFDSPCLFEITDAGEGRSHMKCATHGTRLLVADRA